MLIGKYTQAWMYLGIAVFLFTCVVRIWCWWRMRRVVMRGMTALSRLGVSHVGVASDRKVR